MRGPREIPAMGRTPRFDGVEVTLRQHPLRHRWWGVLLLLLATGAAAAWVGPVDWLLVAGFVLFLLLGLPSAFTRMLRIRLEPTGGTLRGWMGVLALPRERRLAPPIAVDVTRDGAMTVLDGRETRCVVTWRLALRGSDGGAITAVGVQGTRADMEALKAQVRAMNRRAARRRGHPEDVPRGLRRVLDRTPEG